MLCFVVNILSTPKGLCDLYTHNRQVPLHLVQVLVDIPEKNMDQICYPATSNTTKHESFT